MKHLIIAREYPPSWPMGGIGTYVDCFSRLLAEAGEVVHVIGQLWQDAEKELEEKYSGRLIIHRLYFEDWPTGAKEEHKSRLQSIEGKGLYESSYPAQRFSWQACLIAERLIEEEGIDIIEAQEYEAPLYYLQLRRALGLGPKRQPPCVVHLHSPSEFIALYDEWDVRHIFHTTAKRLEDYTIASADALLCPSQFLARQVETHHGLRGGSIQVIPYPLGDIRLLDRTAHTWEHGTICYVGRLERRKGILDWIDAAVTVAYDYPTALFEFIGANVLEINKTDGEQLVERKIPEDLKMRFLFRGYQPRSRLLNMLEGARMAVVPSRWDNFPNTCLEAMGSGLPVIASRQGGMIEMIDDGTTGWLTNQEGSPGLAATLRRALDSDAETLAHMGGEAASAIRRLCDNTTIIDRHMEFRNTVVGRGCTRSILLHSAIQSGDTSDRDWPLCRMGRVSCGHGIGIVITCVNAGKDLDECLATVELQSRKSAHVVIVNGSSTDQQTVIALNQAQRDGWCVIQKSNPRPASAKNAGLEWMLKCKERPLALVFLDANDRLSPGFVSACEAIFLRCPQVGLVSCWALDLAYEKKLRSPPGPSFPYQWLTNEVVSFAAVRTEALLEVGQFHSEMERGYDCWDLFDTVMASGWTAVTLPEILGEARFEQASRACLPDPFCVLSDTARCPTKLALAEGILHGKE